MMVRFSAILYVSDVLDAALIYFLFHLEQRVEIKISYFYFILLSSGSIYEV